MNNHVYTEAEKAQATALLERGRDIVGAGWIKGSMAKMRDGRECSASNPLACKFCSLGAIERSASELKSSSNVKRLAKQRLQYVMGNGIIARNDSSRTSKAMVYGAFDLAFLGAAGF